MERVPYIEEKDHPELAALIARIRSLRGGRLPNLYKVLLNSAPVMEGWLDMFSAIRQKTKLGGRYRELAIMRVAILNGADYEYRAHLQIALKEGLSAEQVAALMAWQVSQLFDAAERAVLAYTDTMTAQVQVPDELIAEVQKCFDAQELVELTATIAGYNMVSRVLVALQVGHETT